MTAPSCSICGMPIQQIDRVHGRVARTSNGEVHAYCRVIQLGMIPECPLYEGLQPKPCSNDCVQAKACPSKGCTNCVCDNVVCQIGQSVRALRAQGRLPLVGYVPNMPGPGKATRSLFSVGGIYVEG